MINENIATLSGSLVFKADYRTLITFEKKLSAVEAKLRAFSDLANRKFNIKVTLDGKALRAQLDKAMNAKITFRNFHVDVAALDLVRGKLALLLDRTPIKLSNIRINISEVLAQRAMLRQQLGSVSVAAKVGLNFKDANSGLRAWKVETEQGFKLRLNADISQAKLFRNAARTLKAVSGKLGTISIHTPKIKLSVDRQHLRAEIASALAQIRREVKIKIDLSSRVSGRPRPASSAPSGFNSGYGLPMGALGGVGAVAGAAYLNRINQQQQGQRMALMSVTGSQEAGKATQARLDAMGSDIGFNTLEIGPALTKMIAAGKGTGFTQDQTEQIFKSMTEYGRVMGLNTEDMKGSLRAVEQMMNKGQIMSEELKGQLGERFPAAVSLMAKSMGKTIPELLKSMKDGKVSSQALLKFAETLSIEARNGGALDAAKRSTAAQQARAENSRNVAIASFSQGGFDQASSDFFGAIGNSFSRNQPALKAMGGAFEMITRPVIALIEVGGKLLSVMPALAAQFGLTGTQLFTLAAAARLAALPFGMVALAIAATALAVEDLIGFSEGKDSLFGRFLAGSNEAQSVFDKLAASSNTFKTNIDGIFLPLGKLSEGLKGLSFGEFLTNSMRELESVISAFNSVVDRFVSAGMFAQRAAGPDGNVIERSWYNMKGLFQGPEENQAWMDRDAEAKRAQAQSELKTQPEQLDRSIGRKSVNDAESTTGEGSPAQRAAWQTAMSNPVTIGHIQIDITGTGILTPEDMGEGMKSAIEKVSQDTFTRAWREADAASGSEVY